MSIISSTAFTFAPSNIPCASVPAPCSPGFDCTASPLPALGVKRLLPMLLRPAGFVKVTSSIWPRLTGSVQPGRTDPVSLGQIELVTFTNPAGLNSIGNNLFTPSAGSGEAVQSKPGEQGAGTLAQGMLEGANVKAVEEMIDMIACQRAYELNSKIISTADQMLQRLTNIR